jgi:hypothetical protein
MSAFEEHFTVNQLAKLWGVSPETARRAVAKYGHLLPDFNKKRRSRFGPIKRHHSAWRIPKSVAERIYRDLIGESNAA